MDRYNSYYNSEYNLYSTMDSVGEYIDYTTFDNYSDMYFNTNYAQKKIFNLVDERSNIRISKIKKIFNF